MLLLTVTFPPVKVISYVDSKLPEPVPVITKVVKRFLIKLFVAVVASYKVAVGGVVSSDISEPKPLHAIVAIPSISNSIEASFTSF